MADAARVLGRDAREYPGRLDTVPTPPGCDHVTMTSDEVTALCPITGQPDWYTVQIEYVPGERIVESKSLKLFFGSLRDQGHFCEALAPLIAREVQDAASPRQITVSVTQKPRGGITITARATLDA